MSTEQSGRPEQDGDLTRHLADPGREPDGDVRPALGEALAADHVFTMTLTSDHGESSMFERYTDRARRTVELAQDAARSAHHSEIGPEHILIGLVDEGGGVAFKSVEALGVTPGMTREAVLRYHPPGPDLRYGHQPFTKDGKKVCEYALRSAIELGNNYIATEHLLLGVVRFAGISPDAPASKALASLGIGDGDKGFASDVREKVLELLRGYGTKATPVAAGNPDLAKDGGSNRAERDAAAARDLITGALLAELGRRLYEYENAIEWHTSCTSCAAVLDSVTAERERAERAEKKLSAAKAVIGEAHFLRQNGERAPGGSETWRDWER
jgi:hypothetical protein